MNGNHFHHGKHEYFLRIAKFDKRKVDRGVKTRRGKCYWTLLNRFEKVFNHR